MFSVNAVDELIGDLIGVPSVIDVDGAGEDFEEINAGYEGDLLGVVECISAGACRERRVRLQP